MTIEDSNKAIKETNSEINDLLDGIETKYIKNHFNEIKMKGRINHIRVLLKEINKLTNNDSKS